MLDEGFWAKSRWAASTYVYSLSATRWVCRRQFTTSIPSWIAPSETVDDIEQGKEKAAAYAEAHLKGIGNLELPSLVWKKSRSA
jgi:hypothetical protein